MDLDGGVPGWCGRGAPSPPAPPHTHGTVRMMICGREHRVSIFLLLFCIVCWVVVVGSVGLMHVAVMFVCWFVSTVLLDFLVAVFSCCLH